MNIIKKYYLIMNIFILINLKMINFKKWKFKFNFSN